MKLLLAILLCMSGTIYGADATSAQPVMVHEHELRTERLENIITAVKGHKLLSLGDISLLKDFALDAQPYNNLLTQFLLSKKAMEDPHPMVKKRLIAETAAFFKQFAVTKRELLKKLIALSDEWQAPRNVHLEQEKKKAVRLSMTVMLVCALTSGILQSITMHKRG